MKTRPAAGFTLIELLLACAILALLLILLAQAVGAVQQTWLSGVARIDNFSKARVILSLLDRDIQSAVLRPDLAAFADESGNPACAFYTQINGSTGNRRISLVRYQLAGSGTGSVFQRADYGLDYTNTTLTLAATNALTDLPKAGAQDVADGILRFEWQFLAADGSFQTNYQYDFANPRAAANTRSVIVSLVALDDRATKIGADTGQLATLRQRFDGQPAAGQTYAAYWNSRLQAAGFANGLPKPLTSGVRVFERHYALHQP